MDKESRSMAEIAAKDKTKDKTKRVLKSIILLFLIYAAFMLNWWFGIFRLRNPPANYIFFLAVLTIPLISTVLSFWFPLRRMRIISVLILLPFVLLSISLGGLVLYVLPDVIRSGEYAFFTKRETIKMPHYNVSLYGFAYSITVRQEKEIFPGLLLIRDVYENTNLINVEAFNENQIKITYPEFVTGGVQEKVEVLTLKRFVYF